MFQLKIASSFFETFLVTQSRLLCAVEAEMTFHSLDSPLAGVVFDIILFSLFNKLDVDIST